MTDVTFIIADLGGGGAQKVLMLVAKYWAEHGKRVHIITLSDGSEVPESLTHTDITLTHLHHVAAAGSVVEAITGNLKRIKAIRSTLRQNPSQHIFSFLTDTNILAILATIGLKSRVIVCERNDLSKQPHKRYWVFLRHFLYRFADTITANAHIATEQLTAFVPTHKIIYLPNPIHIPTVEPSKQKDKLILSIGRLHHQKGYDILLQAFKESMLHERGWQWVILGKGPLETELKQHTKALGLEKAVRWEGYTTDTATWFGKASLFVLASRYEGTPNVALEAALHYVPMIVSDSCAELPYVLTPDTDYFSFKNEESTALAHALQRAIHTDASTRNTMSKTAHEKVCENYAFDTAIKAWDALIA